MRKILSIGRYSLEGEVLGRGNFGRVELATHKYVRVKVNLPCKTILASNRTDVEEP